MNPMYQIGIAVQDLEAAMAELTAAVGTRWYDVIDVSSPDMKLRIAISVEGPPHFELIEASPGSPWDSTAGSRFDHLQWWSGDLEGDTARLVASGLTLDHDFGWLRYFSAPKTGIRVELLRGDPERPGFVPEGPGFVPDDYLRIWGVSEAQQEEVRRAGEPTSAPE